MPYTVKYYDEHLRNTSMHYISNTTYLYLKSYLTDWRVFHEGSAKHFAKYLLTIITRVVQEELECEDESRKVWLSHSRARLYDLLDAAVKYRNSTVYIKEGEL